MKTTKIYLFLLPPLPSQDGGLLQPPQPPTFSRAKIFEKFFHRYMGIWTKGGQIDPMTILAKTQKWKEGKSPLRERVKMHSSWKMFNAMDVVKITERFLVFFC